MDVHQVMIWLVTILLVSNIIPVDAKKKEKEKKNKKKKNAQSGNLAVFKPLIYRILSFYQLWHPV